MRYLILIRLLSFVHYHSFPQNNSNKDAEVIFFVKVKDSCLKQNDAYVYLTAYNNTNKSILISAKNIFFSCEIIGADGSVVEPNYNIGHSRDWAEQDYYLIEKNDSVTFASSVQKFFYFNLKKNIKYTCVLTYFNERKNRFGRKSRFRNEKLFRGRVSLNSFSFIICEDSKSFFNIERE